MRECPGLFASVFVHTQIFVDEFIGVLYHVRHDEVWILTVRPYQARIPGYGR